MQEQNYIFRFHNPNTEEVTAAFFLRTAVEANAQKIEEMIVHIVSSKEPKRSAESKAFLSASI